MSESQHSKKAATASQRVVASQGRRIAGGAHRLSGMIVAKPVAAALARLLASGYAETTVGCVSRALLDAAATAGGGARFKTRD